MSGSVFQRAMCAIGSHSCRTESDDQGVWGQCVYCSERFGFVSRAQLRAYADRELPTGGVKLPVTEDAATGDSQDAAAAQPLGSPQILSSDAQSVRPDGGEG